MVLALLFILADKPVNIDNITPVDIKHITIVNKERRHKEALHEALVTIYRDASDGQNCSLIMTRDPVQQDFLKEKLKAKGFEPMEQWSYQNDKPDLLLHVCW